jgi:hypothetical protein
MHAAGLVRPSDVAVAAASEKKLSVAPTGCIGVVGDAAALEPIVSTLCTSPAAVLQQIGASQ